jgi:hypothetical protein
VYIVDIPFKKVGDFSRIIITPEAMKEEGRDSARPDIVGFDHGAGTYARINARWDESPWKFLHE